MSNDTPDPDSSSNETPDPTAARSKRWWSRKAKEPIDPERAGYQALGRAIVGGGLIVVMVTVAWLVTVIAGWVNG